MKRDQVAVDSRGKAECDQDIFDSSGNVKAGTLRRALDTLVKYAKIMEEESTKNNGNMDINVGLNSNQDSFDTNNNS